MNAGETVRVAVEDNALGQSSNRAYGFHNTKEEDERAIANNLYPNDIEAQNEYLRGRESVGSSSLVKEAKGVFDPILHPIVTIKGTIVVA